MAAETKTVISPYVRPYWADGLAERPERYRFIFGGRASSKSYSVVHELVLLMANRPLRLVCLREFREDITESIHELFKIAIGNLGVEAVARANDVVFANGSYVTYRGVERNARSLKGLENFDLVWFEEGQEISEASWLVADPTFRKTGTQIWVTFNPTNESDIVYQMAVVDPIDDAVIIETNWRENPGLTETMIRLILRMRRSNPEHYEHVYEGKLRAVGTGNPFGGRAAIDACIIPEISRRPVVAFGVDEAFTENNTSDWTVVLGLDDRKDLAFYKRWRDENINRRHREIAQIVGDVPTLVDDTAGRGYLSNALTELGCRAVSGIVFTTESKRDMILGLADNITDGRVGLPRRVDQPGENGVLLDELRHFIRDERGVYRPQSPNGNDDTVDGLALAVKEWDSPRWEFAVA